MRKGDATRERILEIAEAAVLAKGFGATSIEELIAEAGLTKSGFFYHFKDKNELARGLLLRYEQQNNRLIESVFGRGRELSEDPLQAFLIGLNLFAERIAAIPEGHPGCIVATMSYQDRLFDRDVRALVAKITREWSEKFCDMLDAIAKVYPPREPVDLTHVARMVCCMIDGGIILSKALGRPEVLPEQLLMVRNYVKLLFQPAVAVAVAPPREQVAA
jgi:TetR/AcrR family transcriptional regulator, transcriptional repressor for nem operon